MPDADLLADARCTIATLQAALSRAHEQIRERDALAAALNRKVAKTLANLEHAEERAAELQRRIDEAKAAREARQKALQAPGVTRLALPPPDARYVRACVDPERTGVCQPQSGTSCCSSPLEARLP